MTMNHIIDRPFASPISTSNFTHTYPDCTDSEPEWRLQEKLNNDDWTDQEVEYASIQSSYPNDTTATHTIKLLDQVPENTRASHIAISRFKHRCDSSIDFHRVTASIAGKIEVNNSGFERLAMYFCPDYKINNLPDHPDGWRIAGTTKLAQPAKWQATPDWFTKTKTA